ncbi:hypothetical protein Hte_005344 [Hypoxylon texense]
MSSSITPVFQAAVSTTSRRPPFKHADLVISKTPNILLYLGPRLGLAGRRGDRENDVYRVKRPSLSPRSTA